MKLYKVCAFALCLLLAGCGINRKAGSASEAGAAAPAIRETTPSPPAAVTGDTGGAPAKELAGLWHAGDSVGSGYAARYEFHEDGAFLYAANEMDDLAAADAGAAVPFMYEAPHAQAPLKFQ